MHKVLKVILIKCEMSLVVRVLGLYEVGKVWDRRIETTTVMVSIDHLVQLW